MENKLPTFSVQGTEQELIEIEMILIMLGYDVPDEDWNKNYSQGANSIWCYSNIKNINYHRSVSKSIKNFHASQLTEIINYVTTYNK
jgi:hypothetical protein